MDTGRQSSPVQSDLTAGQIPAPRNPFPPDASSRELLHRISERCQKNLAKDTEAQDFLRRNGVTDESVWAAFRLGVGDPQLLDVLGADDYERLDAMGLLPGKGPSILRDGGIHIPTFDPSSPVQPVGLIKQNYGQNKHAFATTPCGLACATDINEHSQAILADAPLLGLRLAQAGAKGITIVEALEVLAQYSAWLKERRIVFVSYKAERLEPCRKLFDQLGIQASFHAVQAVLANSAPKVLASLGIEKGQFTRPEQKAVPITPALLHNISSYAQNCLLNGQGHELLQRLGVNTPEFVETFGLGVLPSDFREALPSDAKATFKGKLKGNSLLVPALNEAGAPADLLSVHFSPKPTLSNLLETPQGLIAPKILTAFPEIFVTTSIAVAAKCFSVGVKNVLVLRGVEDAKNNLPRIQKTGVKKVTVLLSRTADSAGLLEAFSGAAIDCSLLKLPKRIEDICSETLRRESSLSNEPYPLVPEERTKPAPFNEDAPARDNPRFEASDCPYPEKPLQVEFDRRTERARFKAGDAEYTIDTSLDMSPKLEVRLERAGKVHLDRFDLSKEAQRGRFATNAAMRTGVPFEIVQAHLISLLDAVRALQEKQIDPLARSKPRIEVSEEDRKEAAVFLSRPDLLDAIAKDMESIGWVGEENAKRLLYLIGLSRKLPKPLSATMRAPSGAGKSTGTETVALLCPEEDQLHVSRLSDAALFYFDRAALKHRLLVVDEADAMTSEVLTSLRVLQSRGALSQSYTARDPYNGQTVTHTLEIEGPVAVLTSTTREMDEQNLSRCFEIGVDESPEQTRRIQEAQRRLRSDPAYLGQDGKRAHIIRRHHAMQRTLEALPVIIPYAERIEFPSTGLKFRREHDRFLNLIEASALLHQYQRKKAKTETEEPYILADERDFQIAVALAAEHVARASQELSENARGVLTLIRASGQREFTMEALQALKPEWTRYRFRDGLQELLGLEYVTASNGGRGKLRRYRLVSASIPLHGAPSIRLRAVGELAKVGETDFAKLSPKTRTG